MTVPAVPVDAYAADLAQMIADALTLVLPYAAAITAFVIGLRMLKRWLGHRAATSLGGPSRYNDYDDYDEAYDDSWEVDSQGRQYQFYSKKQRMGYGGRPSSFSESSRSW